MQSQKKKWETNPYSLTMSDDYDENPMMIFFSSAEEQHRIQTKISYTKIIIFFVKSISRNFFVKNGMLGRLQEDRRNSLLDH